MPSARVPGKTRNTKTKLSRKAKGTRKNTSRKSSRSRKVLRGGASNNSIYAQQLMKAKQLFGPTTEYLTVAFAEARIKDKKPVMGIDSQGWNSMEAKDLQPTLDKFMNSFNQSLSKDEEDHKQKLEESKQRHREKGYFGEDRKIDSFEEGDYVVYYNPNSGIEIFNNICSIFPDKNNPFYEGEVQDKIKMFLFSPIYSKELTEYFIEKHASTFDYFKTGAGEKYLKDFDFLLRFWKNEKYYSKPSITYL